MSYHEVFEEPFYRFLVGSGKTVDPVAVIDQLRSNIAGMHEQKAMFRAQDALDGDTHSSVMRREYAVLVGSWEAPDHYSANRYRKYVNPEHEYAERYTDAVVECGCGAPVVRHKVDDADDPVIPREHDHADGCTRADRFRARARLYEKRAEVLEEAVKLGVGGSSLTARLGMADDSGDRAIKRIGRAMKLPTDRWREEARAKRVNTEAALVALGYPTEEVGRVWDVGASTVRGRIARLTDWDISGLREAGTPYDVQTWEDYHG